VKSSSRFLILLWLLALRDARGQQEEIVFRHTFDDQVLDLRPQSGEALTSLTQDQILRTMAYVRSLKR
jgi:hypothetical protein